MSPLLIFKSQITVLKAEQTLKNNLIPHEIVPQTVLIANQCGLAIKLDSKIIGDAKKILERESIDCSAYYPE